MSDSKETNHDSPNIYTQKLDWRMFEDVVGCRLSDLSENKLLKNRKIDDQYDYEADLIYLGRSSKHIVAIVVECKYKEVYCKDGELFCRDANDFFPMSKSLRNKVEPLKKLGIDKVVFLVVSTKCADSRTNCIAGDISHVSLAYDSKHEIVADYGLLDGHWKSLTQNMRSIDSTDEIFIKFRDLPRMKRFPYELSYSTASNKELLKRAINKNDFKARDELEEREILKITGNALKILKKGWPYNRMIEEILKRGLKSIDTNQISLLPPDNDNWNNLLERRDFYED